MKAKSIIAKIVVLCLLLSLGACGSSDSTSGTSDVKNEIEEMQLKIDDSAVNVEWADNDSVKALAELVSEKPLTIKMSMYGGFEQVGSLGRSLPRNDVRTRTSAGDIVLYSGNQIVIFYGSNTWAYTRLGKITGLSGNELTELLGNKDVTITISK